MAYVGESAGRGLAYERPHRGYADEATRPVSPCPEINCVRHRLTPEICEAAERRALALGIGAHEVLLAAGIVEADVYYRAFAFSLGLHFCDLNDIPREAFALADERLIDAVNARILPLRRGAELDIIIAPSGLDARALATHVSEGGTLHRAAMITTPERLRRFAAANAEEAIAFRAIEALRDGEPAYSAAVGSRTGSRIGVIVIAVLIAAMIVMPLPTIVATQISISLLFLAWTALRLRALWFKPPADSVLPRQRAADLPVYTVILALHDEQRSVPGLVRALRALDYPPEKLDVKFVLEPDDDRTRAAFSRIRLPETWEIVTAVDAGPRTKPKALNCALPFARGEYTVVYDAEDRPEPDQLRRALDAFANDDPSLACVQARLTIDNTDDGWLAALFTSEYAGQFDILLPGLVARDLPIPLGGSSNHFRTSVLRQVGAWDPYNVTEDADLGTRLARLGYRSGMIASSTYEEAPTKIRPWISQRTRWFKGWLQTWCVHMRQPRRFSRELGWRGFVAFQLLLVGTVFAALLQPIALLLLAAGFVLGTPSLPFSDSAIGLVLLDVHLAALLSGYATSIVIACAGLAHRRLLWVAWLMPLMVVQWALLSYAAWRALYQFIADPFRWEKTAHGLARTSRRADALQPTDSVSDRQQRRPRSA